MFRSITYSIFFMLLCSSIWFGNYFANPFLSGIPDLLVTVFLLMHLVRLTEIISELHQDTTAGFCPLNSRVEPPSCTSVPSVNLQYIIASVVVLWFLDYTAVSVALLVGYLVTHGLYKHYKLTSFKDSRRTP